MICGFALFDVLVLAGLWQSDQQNELGIEAQETIRKANQTLRDGLKQDMYPGGVPVLRQREINVYLAMRFTQVFSPKNKQWFLIMLLWWGLLLLPFTLIWLGWYLPQTGTWPFKLVKLLSPTRLVYQEAIANWAVFLFYG